VNVVLASWMDVRPYMGKSDRGVRVGLPSSKLLHLVGFGILGNVLRRVANRRLRY